MEITKPTGWVFITPGTSCLIETVFFFILSFFRSFMFLFFFAPHKVSLWTWTRNWYIRICCFFVDFVFVFVHESARNWHLWWRSPFMIPNITNKLLKLNVFLLSIMGVEEIEEVYSKGVFLEKIGHSLCVFWGGIRLAFSECKFQTEIMI